MEDLLGLAKAIPPDIWLVLSLFASAVVIGLHWILAHLVGRHASTDEPQAETRVDNDRELLGS